MQQQAYEPSKLGSLQSALVTIGMAALLVLIPLALFFTRAAAAVISASRLLTCQCAFNLQILSACREEPAQLRSTVAMLHAAYKQVTLCSVHCFDVHSQ